MKSCPAVVGLLLSVCLATPVLGQGDHPNRAAGISAQTLYSSSGTDDINLFNGNLHYRIPIGEPVAVGPLLSIAPALVYNSQAEKVWRVCKDNEEHPTGDRAIGPGWRLHFGRLVPVETRIPRGSTDCWQPSTPEAPLVDNAVEGMISTRWAYEDPEGGIHEFYDRFVEFSCNTSDSTSTVSFPKWLRFKGFGWHGNTLALRMPVPRSEPPKVTRRPLRAVESRSREWRRRPL